MGKQLSLVSQLWEIGYQRCVKGRGDCRFRPCTSAQGVYCCKECEFECKQHCNRADMRGNDK